MQTCKYLGVYVWIHTNVYNVLPEKSRLFSSKDVSVKFIWNAFKTLLRKIVIFN